MHSLKKLYLLTFLLLLAGVRTSFAQAAATGKLSGKVLDADENTFVVGAMVVVKEVRKFGRVEMDGTYLVENIPAGTYTVEVKYAGYQPMSKPGVTIVAKQVTEMDFAIRMQGKAVTVHGQKMTPATVDAMISTIKVLGPVASGISSEQMKQLPGRSTSDAMKRVSGATIVDGKFAIIRGLNDRYNGAMVNGAPLPSTEAERRAFSFDIFPSNMLDNILVIKTATPDLPGDFAGGIIQLNTKDVPDKAFAQISLGGSFNSLTTGQDFRYYQGSNTDWLAFDNGYRSLPEGFSNRQDFQKLTTTQKYDLAKRFPNNWAIQTNSALPNGSLQFSLGQTFRLNKRDSVTNRNKLGIVGALDYSNSRKFTTVDRAWYSQSGKEYSFLDSQFVNTVTIGGLLNLAYKRDGNNHFSLKTTLNRSADDQLVQRNGQVLIDGFDQKVYAYYYASNMLLLSQFNGEHYWTNSKVKLNYNASAGRLTKDVPDFRTLTYQRRTDSEQPFSATIQNEVTDDGGARFFSDLNEKLYSASFNATIPVQLGKAFLQDNNNFKTGVYTQIKDRNFDARVLGYVLSNMSNYPMNRQQPGDIFKPENFGPKGYTISDITKGADSYEAGSDLYAGYVMMDNTLPLKPKNNDMRLRLIYGVRFESYRQKIVTGANASGDAVRIDTTINDFLPSLNVTLQLNPRHQFRVSGSRTLARPEFRELAPFAFLDFNNFSVLVGNSKLTRTSIWNADVRYEFYPSQGQTFSAAAFVKRFDNPIEVVVPNDANISNMRRTWANVPSARSYGLEAEFRQKLSFVTDYDTSSVLDDFTLFGNVAYIFSEVTFANQDDVHNPHRPMQGQSPYIVNVGLQYANSKTGTTATLAYNRFGNRIFSVGSKNFADIYEQGRSVFDIQLSQRITKKFEMKVSVSDVLAQNLIFFQDNNRNKKFDDADDNMVFRYRSPRIFGLTLSYKF